MTTYYIDPEEGKNANDGLSAETPKFSLPTPTSNNTYLFKRGTTYAASIVINSGVTGVTIDAYGNGNKPIINPGASDRWSVRISVGCTGTTIANLELTGALGNGSQTCFGIYIGSGVGATSDFVVVRDCYIHDITSNTAGDCDGIIAFGNNIEISCCVIRNIPDDGIWIEGLRANIRGNKISNVGTDNSVTGDCIQLNGETASSSAGEFRIIGNYLDHSNRLEKQGFIVSSASLGYGGQVAFNTCIFPLDVSGIGGNACFYSDQPGCQFIGNTTIGGTYGILLDTGTSQQVLSNLIIGSYYGIVTSGSPTAMRIDGNTFVDCLYGGAYFDSADNTSYIRNNIFYRCVRGLASHGSINKNTNSYFGNTLYNWASVAGGGAIDSDAFLGDPVLSGSYRPLSGSPLIEAGTYLGSLQDNNSTTYWNPPTIGAYEYIRPRTMRS